MKRERVEWARYFPSLLFEVLTIKVARVRIFISLVTEPRDQAKGNVDCES